MRKTILGGTSGGGAYTEIQKLLASDLASTDYFGFSVAISADGNTVLIGAYVEDTSPATDNGAAYVFTRSGSTWTEQQKLTASDLATGDGFGYSVALSSDGNTAIIGAVFESTSPYTENGAAYVFTRSGSTWTEQQKLTAGDLASNDNFGQSVALSSDGNTALIGAPFEDTSSVTNNGAAYVFTRSGSTWTEQQKLLANDPGTGAQFGYSVALSSDGNTAIIGANRRSFTPNGDEGAAYVFTRSGSTWNQQERLVTFEGGSRFGQSVALSSDGNTALVGAPYENTPGYTDNGAAYVFTRSGSTWTQQQKLTASDLATDDLFGFSIASSADGNIALVGSRFESTSPVTNNGAAYIFTRSGTTWTQQQKLTASDLADYDGFGYSVALDSSGYIALIGAPFEDTSPSTNNGAAYVFVS